MKRTNDFLNNDDLNNDILNNDNLKDENLNLKDQNPKDQNPKDENQIINYFDWLPTVVIGVIMQFVQCAYRGADLQNRKYHIASANNRTRAIAISLGLPITPEMNQTTIESIKLMTFLQYRLVSKRFNEAVKMCIWQWSLFLEKYGPKHIGEDSEHISGVNSCRLNKKGKCHVAKHYKASTMKPHFKADDKFAAYKTAITIFGEKHLRWVGKKIIRKRTRQEMLNTTWPDETSTLKLAAKLKALENTYARDKIAYKNATGKEWKDIVVKQNK